MTLSALIVLKLERLAIGDVDGVKSTTSQPLNVIVGNRNMKLTRRSFVKWFGAAAAVAVVPNVKAAGIPDESGYEVAGITSNHFNIGNEPLTSDLVAREALVLLNDNLVMSRDVFKLPES
jgi:hypothetical protein